MTAAYFDPDYVLDEEREFQDALMEHEPLSSDEERELESDDTQDRREEADNGDER